MSTPTSTHLSTPLSSSRSLLGGFQMHSGRCIHALPLRLVDSNLLARQPRYTCATLNKAFSTSSPRQRIKEKIKSKKDGGETLIRGRPAPKAKAPEPGERKAIRKRIVLSNTNALEVPDLQELSAENMTLNSAGEGKVVGIPQEMIDRLRAVEAFKPKQGWSYFARPHVLLRREATMLGTLVDEISAKSVSGKSLFEHPGTRKAFGAMQDDKTARTVICGDKGAGKSVLLLEAMVMAWLKNWVVISIPEARDLTIGHTAFLSSPHSDIVQYTQPQYTADLLKKTLAANKEVLSGLRLSKTPDLPFTVKDDITLADFVQMGATDPTRAWAIFEVFWSEVTTPNSEIDVEAKGSRPPVLYCLDSLSHILNDSKYQILSEENKLKPIHAHDLVQVKHFVDHLSGQRKLGNGGIVLAATSASDAPTSEAMEVGINIADIRQNESRASPKPTPYSEVEQFNPDKSEQSDALSNFTSPYQKIDQRYLSALHGVGVMRLRGVSKPEAQDLMMYWAKSGMVRDWIDAHNIQTQWALAGSGVLGELEKAVVRVYGAIGRLGLGEKSVKKKRQG